MGQKVNPLGFRLGTKQNHYSLWFAKPKNFSMGLQEDEKIRSCIRNYAEKYRKISKGYEGIVRIEIQRKFDLLQATIYIGYPRLLLEILERERGGIRELMENIRKEFHSIHSVNQKFNMDFKSIANLYEEPYILAEYMALQLKNRIPFRKTMRKIVEYSEEAGADGIQVQIKGRLGGKERARAEWIRKGRVPLQTVCAKINHCSYTIRTRYGVLGLKIWIFFDEE